VRPYARARASAWESARHDRVAQQNGLEHRITADILNRRPNGEIYKLRVKRVTVQFWYEDARKLGGNRRLGKI
jgi:hypothetical protein